MRNYIKNLFYLVLILVLSSARADEAVSFFRAVNVDNASGVSALLARGFDPNTADERGQVALYLAMREDAPKVAAALIAHPATRIDATNAAGETPLMMAALRGRLDWMQRFIERGAQLRRDGWTPLHYAASGPEPRAVTLLLDRGAPIDARSPNGSTPLMMAARYGDEAATSALLARGADPTLRNERGLNAADFARLGGRDALAARLEALAR
ncbi:ankyrin repeat domain-containing protein [Rubrivivax sp. RP6-9]|uniref:ankyrin repeat domain-containing protein n=1 Tax=Rubrivivax sp. RP6-9 TaxID=3415750 RepID=UPI003CC5A628